jgi:hypothetical protein
MSYRRCRLVNVKANLKRLTLSNSSFEVVVNWSLQGTSITTISSFSCSNLSFHLQIYHIKESLKIPKGATRIRKSKDRQHNGQKKKDKQHNGQKKKDKQRSTKHTHKTKNRVEQTPLITGGERRCSGRVSCSCSTSTTRRVNFVTKQYPLFHVVIVTVTYRPITLKASFHHHNSMPS